jgi:hypothetical protein
MNSTADHPSAKMGMWHGSTTSRITRLDELEDLDQAAGSTRSQKLRSLATNYQQEGISRSPIHFRHDWQEISAKRNRMMS